MKVKKITKPELEGDTYLIAQAVNHNAELLEGALNRIKELEKEEAAGKPLEIEEFKPSEGMTREEAISLVRTAFDEWENELNTGEDWSKEHNARDMAINALFREPFEPCGKVRTEIEAQEKWLAEAGYNAYNVGIAFESIKRALGK